MSACTENANHKLRVCCKCFPARWMVLIMNFLGTFSMYCLRTNLSAAIVSMVDYEKLNQIRNSQLNSTFQNISFMKDESMQYTEARCKENYINNEGQETSTTIENKKFLWDENMQGLALGCYFYGYLCSQIIGTWISRRLGRVRVWGFSLLFASICTILSPLALEIGFEAFVAARILIGFFSGVTYPVMYALWAKWAPPTERGSLMSISTQGSQFGVIVTLPLTGILATTFGWQSAFYVTGAIGCIWSVSFMILVYDSPTENPRISEKEKNMIQKSLGHAEDSKSSKENPLSVPWKSILKSYRLWVAYFVSFSSDFVLLVFFTSLPTYLKTIMNFDIRGSASLSAIPYIVKFIVGLFAGWIGDRLILMGMRAVTVRKLCQSISMFIPGLALIIAAYIECNIPVVMIAFTFCVASESLTVPGVKVAMLDMAPQFVGVIYAIANTICTTAGFIAPQIAGILRKAYQDNPIQGWRILFWLSTSLIFVGAISFIIFGTSEVQDWAKPEDEKKNMTEEENKLNKETESVA